MLVTAMINSNNKQSTRQRIRLATSMSSFPIVLVVVLVLFGLPKCESTTPTTNQATVEITSDGGTEILNTGSNSHHQQESKKRDIYDYSADGEVCRVHFDVCKVASSSQLYERGTGSAMTYKPNQPGTKILYHENHERDMYRTPQGIPWGEDWNDISKYEILDYSQRQYNIANNPTKRTSYIRKKLQPPELAIVVNVLKCDVSYPKRRRHYCCCTPLTGPNTGADPESDERIASVDLWHAYPNGTYPSLRDGIEDGICRSKQYIRNNGNNRVRFYTFAPGSTGLFQGLHRDGLDILPWGPPVLHILVQTNDRYYDDLLVDIPIVFQDVNTSLAPSKFQGNDYRPQAFIGKNRGPVPPGQQKETKYYTIRRWQADESNRLVELEIDLYLQPIQPNVTKSLCSTKSPKKFTDLRPKSFFLEPLAVCAPSFLDLFKL